MDKFEKEKQRKREWYQKNKEKMKLKKENQLSIDSPVFKAHSIKSIIIIVLSGIICLAVSSVLIHFSSEVLGKDLIGYSCAVLLEIGIITLSVLKPQKKIEYYFVKILFALFLIISIYILYAGSLSGNDKLSKIKIGIANEFLETAKNMPADYASKRKEALESSLESLKEIKNSSSFQITLSKLAIRFVLLIENLIFAHILARQKW